MELSRVMTLSAPPAALAPAPSPASRWEQAPATHTVEPPNGKSSEAAAKGTNLDAAAKLFPNRKSSEAPATAHCLDADWRVEGGAQCAAGPASEPAAAGGAQWTSGLASELAAVPGPVSPADTTQAKILSHSNQICWVRSHAPCPCALAMLCS